MKVNVTELGGGLTRLDIEPTCSCEPRVIPTHIADDIMRDVVKREKNGKNACCGGWATPTATRSTCPSFTKTNSWERPLPAPRGSESGFDAHIDKPVRSNYGGSPWLADEAFRKDMAKYNNALNAVKKCDWPCREDLKGVPSAISQHNPYPQTKYVGVPTAAPRNVARPVACSSRESVAIKNAIAALNALVNEFGF